jgi:hypothetical protein
MSKEQVAKEVIETLYKVNQDRELMLNALLAIRQVTPDSQASAQMHVVAVSTLVAVEQE